MQGAVVVLSEKSNDWRGETRRVENRSHATTTKQEETLALID
jgi:hypothetical protein